MRVYFEQRELYYVDIEDTETYEEAVEKANWMLDDLDRDFWTEANETGEIELHWHDEETSTELENFFP